MANAVPRTREEGAVPCGRCLEEAVIIRVAEVRLKQVVIDVGYGELGLHTGHAEHRELKPGHRAGRILSQRLVDANTYRLSGSHLAIDNMSGDQSLTQGLCHGGTPSRVCVSNRRAPGHVKRSLPRDGRIVKDRALQPAFRPAVLPEHHLDAILQTVGDDRLRRGRLVIGCKPGRSDLVKNGAHFPKCQ